MQNRTMLTYRNWTRRRIEYEGGKRILFESPEDPIDYSVFKKSKAEKILLKAMKANCKNNV